MGDRDAGVGRASNRRRNARHDLDRNARRDQLLGLFAAATEDEWIAAFEAHDALPLLRLVDEQLIDLVLRQRVCAGPLADIHDLGRRRETIDDVGGDKRVDGDEIGVGDQFRGSDREKTGVAGTGADEKDFALHEINPS